MQFTLEILTHLYDNAKDTHESVIVLLPQKEQETQSDWFKHMTKCKTDFMEDASRWLPETGRPFPQTGHVTADLPIADDADISPTSPVEPVELKETIIHTDEHDIPLYQSNIKATFDVHD